ncbi:uncharacterized protein LOC110691133 [Chenopodium quinoa]|uniref:uncharacterized protein LOC110691133 n=1 Tax=Chenopodium quinoa TaxID=63459 RepID=UPI000B7964C8|nr:uncharacterized protein LOC110691133 [Chenopodium quinoa]
MRIYKPPIPFPHRIVETKLNEKFSKFLEVMRGLQVNIPFLHAMSQMLTYANFLKDLLSNKSRLEESATISLPKEVSAIIQNKLPQKLGDPGGYAIPVNIGDLKAMDALCDLGASVSLMPYSIAKILKVGDLKPTRMSLQLANRTVTLHLGILEDVPVQVGRVFVPCDFVVMEMEEDTRVPLILGKPFLNIAGVVIDMKEGRMTLKVGDEKISFSFSQPIKKPLINEVHTIDTLERDLEEFRERLYERDPLQATLMGGLVEEGGEAKGYDLLLNQPVVYDVMKFEVLNVEAKEERTTPPPKVELKPLPPLLKYAFLEDSESYSVILNSKLDNTSLKKLLVVLREYRDVIGYKIDDIKGISPTICMHKILLDDDHASLIEHQRRLNPNMKEVVKKDVLKLLEAGIIYPIFDSKWVSPVQIVPKKGGMTIIKNDKGETTSTRSLTGWRMCIDYRKLNKSTRKDHFPFPFIDQILERLASHSHYCFLDGYSGFFQISIQPDDQEKTTFTCPFGTFAYQMMPFELCNAPSIFQRLKEALISAPIIPLPNPFELMCDASDFAVGSVLGQRKDKKLHAIYYTSKTLDEAQRNYTTTEKEFLAIVHAIEKFRSYLLGSKVIVFTDHSALKYLLSKKEPKPRLIRWVLLLQDYDIDIRDKKDAENGVADHLSRLPIFVGDLDNLLIDESFPGNQLFAIL